VVEYETVLRGVKLWKVSTPITLCKQLGLVSECMGLVKKKKKKSPLFLFDCLSGRQAGVTKSKRSQEAWHLRPRVQDHLTR
jgi:hypothetical protein